MLSQEDPTFVGGSLPIHINTGELQKEKNILHIFYFLTNVSYNA